MIKYPFNNKEARVKWYLINSIVFSLVTSSIAIAAVDNFSALLNSILNYIFFIGFYVFIGYAVFSMVYACRKLSKPGISS